MNLFLHTLLIFIATVLQVSFFSQISFLGGSLNLILVILLSWLYRDRQDVAFYWAIVSGVLLDLLSPTRFGLYLFLLLLIYLFNYFLLRRFIFRKNLLIIFLLVFFSSLIYDGWFLWQDGSSTAAKIILASAIINSLFTLFVKYWLDYYNRQKETIKI